VPAVPEAAAPPAGEYPPVDHLLRDLRLSITHLPDGSSEAILPVVDDVRAPSGAVRAGAVATVVDVVGGGLAAVAASPGWIATADLTLHTLLVPAGDQLLARARVARSGRTTVVLEVTISDGGERIGLATMSFAVLERRANNPVIGGDALAEQMSVDFDGSGFRQPLRASIGITPSGDPGVVEMVMSDYVRNTLGAAQGGVIAAIVDAAAENALQHACGGPVEVVDLQLTYLALGRVGPIRSRVRVLEANAQFGRAHVELVDAGAADRVTTLARATAVMP
jgi:acyl-coenzyme A thioesterase PaaI-like protein